MSNREHLRILKCGVETWNQWRKAKPAIKPNLRHTRLIGPNLIEPDNKANQELKRVDISPAELSNVNFSETDLSSSLLMGAELTGADFTNANLEHASLVNAVLFNAKFYGTKLKGASLVCAYLSDAHFRDADLTDTGFSGALFGWSTFSNVDLGVAKGLKDADHEGPSTIGLDTIRRSRGAICDPFLRGCGLSDLEIEIQRLNRPDLDSQEIREIVTRIQHFRLKQSTSVRDLFLSFSHRDGEFVDRLAKSLADNGIRYWRYDHHATAGRIERQLDRAIREHSIMLLVLSGHSVDSDWVQHEARLARELERETKRDVLCPILLDESWRNCKWPERLREQITEYNLLDFSNWTNENSFQETFQKLLDGIERFY